MTGQVSDEVLYKKEVYSLVAVNGKGLCTPDDFGMKPYSSCTACWRGYMMWYKCDNDELLLDGMSINVDKPAKVNGKLPKPTTDMFKFMYEELSLKTKFTGSILIAKDFIQSMYVHMGFQSPETYRTVIRLEVQKGEIVREDDLSSRMEEFRRKGKVGLQSPPSGEKEDVMKWIEQRFSLDRDTG